MVDPNMWWTLMGNQQYGQQNQGDSGGGQSPWLSGAGGLLGGLAGYFGGADQRKQDKYWFDQGKELHDLIRWQMLGQKAVSPQMLNQMTARNRQALAPTRANMLWGASRNAGLGSGQTWNTYMQNYLPIEAGLSNQNQQWATNMNEQKMNYLLSLLAGMGR